MDTSRERTRRKGWQTTTGESRSAGTGKTEMVDPHAWGNGTGQQDGVHHGEPRL
ncbi:MAG: hypothetical protein ACXAC5_15080 [Promethearchaeota archaeon]